MFADGASPWTAVGEIRSQGVELEGRAQVTDNLDLLANLYVYRHGITEDARCFEHWANCLFFVPDHAPYLG